MDLSRLRRSSASAHLGFVTFTVLLLAACSPEPTDDELPTGYWSAKLALPGGEAGFGLELGREAESYRGTLINGPERVTVPIVSYDENQKTLLLNFPAFNNRIEARFADGQLTGNLTLVKRDGVQTIPFSAKPGNVAESAVAADIDVSGRWAVTFTEDDGTTYPAIGEFAQRGARLVGTFLTETGDYRYLAGEVRGAEVLLSTFDGAHAFLFKAQSLPNKSLLGEFWSGLSSYETFVADRDEDATLADANTLTYLNPGYERFSFEFPNPGGQIVSLDDARFDGKVVVVTLAGTWCPNCHDEAAFMAKLYERLKERGLEVVALMFEHSDNFEEAARQVQRFRDKFPITYTTLVAGSSDKTRAAEVLPQLNHVLAYPTTIFIDRNGEVRRIHTGFTGPGTGDHYRKLTAEFESLVTELLDETVVVPEPVEAAEFESESLDEAVEESATSEDAAESSPALPTDNPDALNR